ncbi:MAG: nuclear transport factor 2 family protein [Alphaproteobacteria bacterium]|nr:nuclear transport factor 2 family protein [Alphaproteobacteria bacterium]
MPTPWHRALPDSRWWRPAAVARHGLRRAHLRACFAVVRRFRIGNIASTASPIKFRIFPPWASIDPVDSVATMRLELDNWTGHRFTDLFTVLKADGEWKITNKFFHQHP